MKTKFLLFNFLLILLSCGDNEEMSLNQKPLFQEPQLEWGEEVTSMISDTLVADSTFGSIDSGDVIIYPGDYAFNGDTIPGALRLSFRDGQSHWLQRTVKLFEWAIVDYVDGEYRVYCKVIGRSYDQGNLIAISVEEYFQDDPDWRPYRPWMTRIELIKKE